MRNASYDEFYPDAAYPPTTLLVPSGVMNGDLLVEIEAVAEIWPGLLLLDIRQKNRRECGVFPHGLFVRLITTLPSDSCGP